MMEIFLSMGAEQTSGLEDLLMGNVTEGSEETSEQIVARITASQARLAALQKDEKKSTGDDRHLAKIIPYLQPSLLKIVAWMIDREIPSVTILAFVSLACVPAAEIIEKQFVINTVQEFPFLSDITNEADRQKMAEWCELILAADRQSKMVRLSSLRSNAAEFTKFTQGIREILSVFWFRATTEYEANMLNTIARKIAELV